MRKFAFAVVLFIEPVLVHAQTAEMVPVEPGEFYRVEDGLFALRLGQSIDITDRHLMMTLTKGRKDCLAIAVAGNRACIEVGDRFDLKLPGVPFRLGDLMQSRQACFLDVVSTDTAKGEDPTATFRIHCI